MKNALLTIVALACSAFAQNECSSLNFQTYGPVVSGKQVICFDGTRLRFPQGLADLSASPFLPNVLYAGFANNMGFGSGTACTTLWSGANSNAACFIVQTGAGIGNNNQSILSLTSGGLIQWLIDGTGNLRAQQTKGQHIWTFAAQSDISGTLACVAGTATGSFTTNYTVTPVIVVSDETTAGGARISAKSNSGFTITCTGATDNVAYIVLGNPN